MNIYVKFVAIVLSLLFVNNSFAVQLNSRHPINREIEDVVLFLDEHKGYDGIENIRFFSTYAIPDELKENAVLSLSFVIHSLAGNSDNGNALTYRPLAIMKDGQFSPVQNVKNSKTLWWIDLRDYNWTAQAWEEVTKNDGYFVEPIVQHNTNTVLRTLGGNAVVRADWFIFHATDSTLQDKAIYETLLYASTKEPKTIDDFRKIWSLDVKRAQLIGNRYATITTKSNAIARHNRVLFGYNTELGWLYETYDVKEQVGERDYIESFFLNKGQAPSKSDAGETFASNQFGMQVYALRDANNNLIKDADAGVARHISDVNGDVRVRVAHSCMDCHSAGPLHAENTINELLSNGVSLVIQGKENQRRIEHEYSGDEFNQLISQHRERFAKSLLRINGLTPDENKDSYLKIVQWYNAPVTLSQAAKEHGLNKQSFASALTDQEKDNIPGRLILLLRNNESIPRDIWETNGKDGIPGMFQQSYIVMNGLDNTIVKQISKRTKYPTFNLGVSILIEALNDCFIMDGAKIVVRAKCGDKFVGSGDIAQASGHLWHGVLTNSGRTVWIRADDSAKFTKNNNFETKLVKTTKSADIMVGNSIAYRTSDNEKLVSSGIITTTFENNRFQNFVGIIMENNRHGLINADNLNITQR